MISVDSFMCCSNGSEALGGILSRKQKSNDIVDNMVVAIARKNSPGHKAGLRLAKENNQVVIESIAETSIFYGTGLEPGMHVIWVNGVETRNKTVKDITSVINAAERDIEIRASPPIPITDTIPFAAVDPLPPGSFLVEATKKSAKQKVGLRLTRAKRGDSTVVVTSVSKGSMFENSLAPGMKIISINGVKASAVSVKELSSAATKAKHHVSVLASPPSENRKTKMRELISRQTKASLYEYTLFKSYPSTKVGIELQDSRTDPSRIVVAKVHSDGLLANTLVEPGMWVTSFQGQPTSHISASDLSALLLGATGSIKLEIEKPPRQ